MRDYLHFRRRVIGAALLFAALSAVILFLGGVPLGALGYPAAVCGVLGLCFGVWDLLHYRRKIRTLEKLRDDITVTCDNLPEPENSVETGYQELVKLLFQSRAELQAHFEENIADMTDYYTMWAHQIKTPIAAICLLYTSPSPRDS